VSSVSVSSRIRNKLYENAYISNRIAYLLLPKSTFRSSYGGPILKLVPRMSREANNLARLLPNLGGLSGRVRRLYAEVVHSIALYAAPV